jgi:molecular chaperone GrpE
MKEEKEESVEEKIDTKENPEVSESEQNELSTSEEKEDLVEENPLEDLQSELQESKDKYLRLYSEFENFRRRTSKEKLELISTASRDLMESLLPVLDDFERSLKLEKEEMDNEGVRLIYNKMLGILTSKGLKRMEIEPGDEFDDEFHEAITQIPAPDKNLAGKIVDIVEPGYYQGEKVIRFAKVVTGAKE